MKYFLLLIYMFSTTMLLYPQHAAKSEPHPPNVFIRLEGPAQNGWNKSETESHATPATQVTGNDNVSFSSTSEGIYINILKGTNTIKLFALTGQLLLNGDLSQGRFFIPTRKGIYFLRINNHSYKVSCK